MNLTTKATMSSLEMVDFINATREEGASELRHSHFLTKVKEVLGEEMSQIFGSSYVDSMNRTKPCYNFPKREAMLMAMSYSHKLQAKVYDHMTMLEDQLKPTVLATEYAEAAGLLMVADALATMLRVANSGRLSMARQVLTVHAPKALSILPTYVIDAPSDMPQSSSLATHSMTHLLKEFNIEGSTSVWNKKLLGVGILEQLTRKSSSGGLKLYWSVTEKGLEYGKNITNDRVARETQPHWYDSKFVALLNLVK